MSTAPGEVHPGLSTAKKGHSIAALHAGAADQLGSGPILEISTHSPTVLGRQLSAFNLRVGIGDKRRIPLEAAFQGSKVFENGGPFVDLYEASPKSAKGDPRLRTSGELVGVSAFGVQWAVEPKTIFYDWLYLSALLEQPSLAERLTEFEAFTDIEFNPKRSYNCQAHAAALYLQLLRSGRLNEAMRDAGSFRSVIISGFAGRSEEAEQLRLL